MNYNEGSRISEEDGPELLKKLGDKEDRKIKVQVKIIESYNKECYLGYLLLQTLVIEEHIRKILYRIEGLLVYEEKPILRKKKEDLERCTFGTLCESLEMYVESDTLFKGGPFDPFSCGETIFGLEDMVKIRNKVAHRLIYEENNLSSIEEEIKEKYSPEKIYRMIILLSDIGLHLNQREANSKYFEILKQLEVLSSEKKDEIWKFKEF